jgi:hypothetical protein
MSKRDPYAEVGRAMRESIGRAQTAALTRQDWKVLGAILGLLAGYSRLSDAIHTAKLAEQSGYSERKVRESVVKLVAAGAIRCERSRGRYPSRYGLPCPPSVSIDPVPRRSVSPASTLPPVGPSTLPPVGHPSEKDPEEKADDGAERAALSARLGDTRLSRTGYAHVLRAWSEDRVGTEQRLDALESGEWSDRQFVAGCRDRYVPPSGNGKRGRPRRSQQEQHELNVRNAAAYVRNTGDTTDIGGLAEQFHITEAEMREIVAAP